MLESHQISSLVCTGSSSESSNIHRHVYMSGLSDRSRCPEFVSGGGSSIAGSQRWLAKLMVVVLWGVCPKSDAGNFLLDSIDAW